MRSVTTCVPLTLQSLTKWHSIPGTLLGTFTPSMLEMRAPSSRPLTKTWQVTQIHHQTESALERVSVRLQYSSPFHGLSTPAGTFAFVEHSVASFTHVISCHQRKSLHLSVHAQANCTVQRSQVLVAPAWQRLVPAAARVLCQEVAQQLQETGRDVARGEAISANLWRAVAEEGSGRL